MARPLRIEVPGGLYHVIARGNARAEIFNDEVDRDLFLGTFAEAVSRYGLVCHAYCLMPNHYHLVVETPLANLSAAMRHTNGVYTQTFNRRHSRVGHLFQGRYKAILVEKEPHLLELCRYVVLNPVRAGLCQSPAAWRWSSYSATAGLERPRELLTVDWLLEQLDPRRERAQGRYQRFVADAAASHPLGGMRGQIILGSEAFARKHAPSGKIPDVPRAHWQPVRPSLAEIFDAEGEWAIATAHRTFGYQLREIGMHLGVHAATVSRRLRRLEAAGV